MQTEYSCILTLEVDKHKLLNCNFYKYVNINLQLILNFVSKYYIIHYELQKMFD